ncbi:transporter substrate-binding domain-containing protein [Halomonas elongata]|uniref:ABC-type transport system periplasmic substrate-binding protein n=1 Tax=Halomonas elongata (strain ATCC 33173 / DSM 2581 / NBRC 15536 / NCIMB 2198 / 1H9) TaxID=768066 RepID=E1VBX6_HALED|nr:transporter substrate-binding domain-containing protein [Halomonas elongata]MDL4861064.1 transporter substrate-binding domain-containing protein [Halomonas elongata]RAW06547.1 amino acid ABC transporter [Halomonas elongata]WBF19520.1 transporter substrate-binding domain-containing protein [Halomonas elongata]WPU48382.1 transporter substrate-binding domain-containing protein [Halomonas elongata DSM 2581]CBV42246.1 ABC-type transport system periplasmic substrate-binding protein [Halomonas elo
MKRLLTATLTSLCLVPLAQAEVTRVGFATEPYPPFATTDASGELHGWEVDITRAICEAAELECKLVTTSWDGLIPALTGGKIDFIAASLSITDKRRETIAFSDKYYQTPAALAGAKGVELEPTSEGLAGKALGVQSASIHQAYAQAHFPEATLREYQTQDEANQDLFAGRLDATLADRLIIEQFLESKEGQLCCEMTGDVAHDPQTLGDGIGFGVRQDDDALRERLNEAIAEVRANGTYDEITARYFDFDIYGEPDT